jgi:hypothetical protein
MSYQRAVVNCRLCHKLAGEIGEFKEVVSNARNEAMRALEDEARNPINPDKDKYKLDREDSLKSLIGKALTACMYCDYKKPQISEIFKDNEEAV